MKKLSIAVAYFTSVLLTYGASYADFTNSFPELDSHAMRRETAVFSAIISLVGPPALLVVAVESGFFCHGFQYIGGPKIDRDGPSKELAESGHSV